MDWICGACKYNNFKRNDRCKQCSRSKAKPGDWECLKCRFLNFASRAECMKCKSKKAELEQKERDLNALKDANADAMCVVCTEHVKDIAFVPCGHICACFTCAKALDTCPVCRAGVVTRQRVYQV